MDGCWIRATLDTTPIVAVAAAAAVKYAHTKLTQEYDFMLFVKCCADII